jgi:LysR family transcriptional regulator, hydrogen peroxide-inducible genes activator
MNLPTLRQLQFLDAIANEGSFSRAAQLCHVTQPTLSSAIKELEALVGVQLVAREARGASLTRAGVETARRARLVLSEAQDLVAAAHEAGVPLSGEFRLGAIPTIAPYVLPKILPVLHERYPQLRLYLREDTTQRLIDSLHARRIDAALIALPWEAAGIETQTLAEDEFLFVGPRGHPLASRNGLSPDDLDEEEILLLEDGHCLREHALSVCALPAGKGREEVSATSLQTLVQMVAGGLGVSLLPRLAADSGVTAGADVAVRAFTEPVIGRSIGIAWRAGSPRREEARLIGQVVKSTLPQVSPD